MRFVQSTSCVLATGFLFLAPNLKLASAGTAPGEPPPLRERVFFDRDALTPELRTLLDSDAEGPKIVPLREDRLPKPAIEPVGAKRDRRIKVAALGPSKPRPDTDAALESRSEPSSLRWVPTPPVPPLLTKPGARGESGDAKLPVLEDRKARFLEEALAARAENPPAHAPLFERKKTLTERGRLPVSRVPLEHMSTRWSDPLAALTPEEETAPRPEFIMPFANGRVTSLFNQGRRHPAIDLAGALGSPVLCTTVRQTVTFAGWRGGYGNAVITQDAYGRTHLYGHLKAITSRVGQVLLQGDKLGHLGSTGHSTGPHVHYEVKDRKGEHINPVTLLFPKRSVAKGYAWVDVWQEQRPGRVADVKEASQKR
jgi:murein DD-endopeptidase MepM/ murein hydrolase activator NlpD